jgi:uncharacterized protein (DUF433 family)
MDPDTRKQENKRIYELREEGISRAALAERFGITREQVTKIIMAYKRKLQKEKKR